MADSALLQGLDPFDLLDQESDRVHRHLLGGPDWSRPSRCAGWSTREVLGHLAGLEDYVRACLDGTVQELLAAGAAAGATDADGFNRWLVLEHAGVPAAELTSLWWARSSASRAELRHRGREGLVDSSIGNYPAWLQTFHFAVEYATHGDDIGVVVDSAELPARTAWRLRFGLFALRELGRPVEVEPREDLVRVLDANGQRVELADRDFVEATQGRLSADHPLPARWRALLAAVP